LLNYNDGPTAAGFQGGRWVDCRDLSQVFDRDGPLPHPAKDWRQQNLIAR